MKLIKFDFVDNFFNNKDEITYQVKHRLDNNTKLSKPFYKGYFIFNREKNEVTIGVESNKTVFPLFFRLGFFYRDKFLMYDPDRKQLKKNMYYRMIWNTLRQFDNTECNCFHLHNAIKLRVREYQNALKVISFVQRNKGVHC